MYPPLVPALVVQQRQTDREVTVYRLCQVVREVNWTVSHGEAILAVNKGKTAVSGSSMLCLE